MAVRPSNTSDVLSPSVLHELVSCLETKEHGTSRIRCSTRQSSYWVKGCGKTAGENKYSFGVRVLHVLLVPSVGQQGRRQRQMELS